MMINELNTVDPETVNIVNIDIQGIKDMNYKRDKHNTYIYS